MLQKADGSEHLELPEATRACARRGKMPNKLQNGSASVSRACVRRRGGRPGNAGTRAGWPVVRRGPGFRTPLVARWFRLSGRVGPTQSIRWDPTRPLQLNRSRSPRVSNVLFGNLALVIIIPTWCMFTIRSYIVFLRNVQYLIRTLENIDDFAWYIISHSWSNSHSIA